MAKKKKPDDEVKHRPADPNVMGLHPEVLEQPITETLEINYMPYAMSVIVSRAIPEIDGFKPSDVYKRQIYSLLMLRRRISATYSAWTWSMPKPIIRLGTTSDRKSVV